MPEFALNALKFRHVYPELEQAIGAVCLFGSVGGLLDFAGDLAGGGALLHDGTTESDTSGHV